MYSVKFWEERTIQRNGCKIVQSSRQSPPNLCMQTLGRPCEMLNEVEAAVLQQRIYGFLPRFLGWVEKAERIGFPHMDHFIG